jgi:hypothetical protein
MLTVVEPTIRFHSPQEICATWGAVVIRICDGVRTEVDDLVRIQALFDELLESRSAVGMLVVFTHETPLPTTATQRHAINAMSGYGDRLVVAVATLGLGFWASAFRATLDAILRMLRGTHMAIEGTVDAAVARLSSELIGIDPDALASAYQGLWSTLERRAPKAS